MNLSRKSNKSEGFYLHADDSSNLQIIAWPKSYMSEIDAKRGWMKNYVQMLETG